ncbi:MAG: hypothetical protein GY913_30085 [Proteobacteria bacterium]|nr:hypothetical protein [Pseudomonadota bacterium]
MLRAPELVGMDVASAELELTHSARGAYVVGGTSASGWLYLTDEAGAVHSVPIRLGGPSLGFMWAFETNYEGRRWHTRTQVWVPEGTQGHELVGWYSGNSVSLATIEILDEPLSELDAHVRLVNEWSRVPFGQLVEVRPMFPAIMRAAGEQVCRRTRCSCKYTWRLEPGRAPVDASSSSSHAWSR